MNTPFDVFRNILIDTAFGLSLSDISEKYKFSEDAIAQDFRQELGFTFMDIKKAEGISLATAMPYYSEIDLLDSSDFDLRSLIVSRIEANGVLEMPNGTEISLSSDGIMINDHPVNYAIFMSRGDENENLFISVNGCYLDDKGLPREINFLEGLVVDDSLQHLTAETLYNESSEAIELAFKVIFGCIDMQRK